MNSPFGFLRPITIGCAAFALLCSCNLSDPVLGPSSTTSCDSPGCELECEDGSEDCETELCGNGTLDADETCDGDCPTCDDGDDCTEDVMTGSAETCDVTCTNTAIEPCESLCGNGTLDPGETCDGDCPTCDDGEVCTIDEATGSAETCDLVCSTRPTISCFDGDGCCPSNCVPANDGDCACVPLTCEGEGQACGMLDDGCGQTVICGPCGANQTCHSNECLDTQGIGEACPNLIGCDVTGLCVGEAQTGWPDGYCSLDCAADISICPTGTHCSSTTCVQTCTDNSDCTRAPDYECFDHDRDGATECAPVATGSGAIGAPCLNYADCAGGQGAFCIVEDVASGVWKDGYCSQACSNANCPAGSHCNRAGCVADCATDADCRADGYRCSDINGDAILECVPT